MSRVNDIAVRNITRAIIFAKDKILMELRNQGHRASGKTEDQTEVKVEGHIASGLRAHVMMPKHVQALDTGVKPSRVPFSLSGRGGKSKYITALIKWLGFVSPSLNKKARKSRAFAIAITAKSEGHPTRGSYAHSSNGRRKNWTKHAIKDNELDAIINIEEIVQTLSDEIEQAYRNQTV